MYKVIIGKKCGCFLKSGMSEEQSFGSKEEASKNAKEIVERMNSEFCGKHRFEIVEVPNSFNIVEA